MKIFRNVMPKIDRKEALLIAVSIIVGCIGALILVNMLTYYLPH